MLEQQINDVLSVWTAKIGNIDNNARAAWISWLYPLTESTSYLGKIITKIARQYESSGRSGAKPTLQTFQDAYVNSIKIPTDKRKFSDCSFCSNIGIVYLVRAENMSTHRLQNVPKYAKFSSPSCYVLPLPCSCERGLQIHNKTFKYDPQTLHNLVERYAYPDQKNPTSGNLMSSYSVAWVWAIDYQLRWQAGERDQSAFITKHYEPNEV